MIMPWCKKHIEHIKSGDWMRGLSDDALADIYAYYERNYREPQEKITYPCPHCGKEQVVEASGYQIDACDVSIYYNTDDEQAYLDWDNAYIEADFDYVCSCCGASLGFSSLDDLAVYHKGKKESRDE